MQGHIPGGAGSPLGVSKDPNKLNSDECYQTMLDCWHGVPTERPTFTELVERLGDLLQANVQQDGKDYIPLNITLCPDGEPNAKTCPVEESLNNGVNRWSAVETGNNSKKRPLSVKTFDEVPVEKEKVMHEVSEVIASFSTGFTDHSSPAPETVIRAFEICLHKLRPIIP
ncbi:vascular endothelial growth factor receptor kdr-like [Limosa lapponica baueri]|uniref:Vascular endothelial growth factor receptor kdr-like n=1 Tax=Limosa lapponica baueri TaxID=1758121 RepID=A0A2I0TBR6_LIMLA|nr:vascular endothelial growth factor receptor kdr-like [Limosa lapponica baueri]